MSKLIISVTLRQDTSGGPCCSSASPRARGGWGPAPTFDPLRGCRMSRMAVTTQLTPPPGGFPRGRRGRRRRRRGRGAPSPTTSLPWSRRAPTRAAARAQRRGRRRVRPEASSTAEAREAGEGVKEAVAEAERRDGSFADGAPPPWVLEAVLEVVRAAEGGRLPGAALARKVSYGRLSGGPRRRRRRPRRAAGASRVRALRRGPRGELDDVDEDVDVANDDDEGTTRATGRRSERRFGVPEQRRPRRGRRLGGRPRRWGPTAARAAQTWLTMSGTPPFTSQPSTSRARAASPRSKARSARTRPSRGPTTRPRRGRRPTGPSRPRRAPGADRRPGAGALRPAEARRLCGASAGSSRDAAAAAAAGASSAAIGDVDDEGDDDVEDVDCEDSDEFPEAASSDDDGLDALSRT